MLVCDAPPRPTGLAGRGKGLRPRRVGEGSRPSCFWRRWRWRAAPRAEAPAAADPTPCAGLAPSTRSACGRSIQPPLAAENGICPRTPKWRV